MVAAWKWILPLIILLTVILCIFIPLLWHKIDNINNTQDNQISDEESDGYTDEVPTGPGSNETLLERTSRIKSKLMDYFITTERTEQDILVTNVEIRNKSMDTTLELLNYEILDENLGTLDYMQSAETNIKIKPQQAYVFDLNSKMVVFIAFEVNPQEIKDWLQNAELSFTVEKDNFRKQTPFSELQVRDNSRILAMFGPLEVSGEAFSATGRAF